MLAECKQLRQGENRHGNASLQATGTQEKQNQEAWQTKQKKTTMRNQQKDPRKAKATAQARGAGGSQETEEKKKQSGEREE